MSPARKEIEWHGQDAPDLARSFQGLPAGRYVLVPEHELEDDDLALSDEQVAGLIEAAAQAERGEARPLAEVHARLSAKYRALADAAPKR